MELDVSARQFVILGKQPSDDGALAPIGSREEVLRKLARLNTMPERGGDDVLWGPGICVQVPPDVDPITQMLMSITEEEIAWKVIERVLRLLDCRLLDPASGREFAVE